MSPRKARPEWGESVERGRELAAAAARNRWAIADLALETFPWSNKTSSANRWTPTEQVPRNRMRQWIKETGLEMSVQSLAEYRATAHGWPSASRVAGVSFSNHRLLRANPDRFSILRDGVSNSEALVATSSKRTGGVSFPRAARSIDTSAAFLKTAMKALGRRQLSAEQMEELGSKIATLEANLDEMLDRLGMAEPNVIELLPSAKAEAA